MSKLKKGLQIGTLVTVVGAAAAIIGVTASEGLNSRVEAYQAVKNSGYTKIEMSTKGNMFDLKCTGRPMKKGYEFTAYNSNGEKVDGTVCCGLFKTQGCVVKY